MDILCALLIRADRLEQQLQDLVVGCSKLREMVEDVQAEQRRVREVLSMAYGDTLHCDKCGALLVRPQNFGKPGVIVQCPECGRFLYEYKHGGD